MSSVISHEEQVRAFYRTLEQAWGPQHWWPARTCFEVIAGAFLTQNTAWSNVELALANLRRERILCVAGIRRITLRRLEQLIRPAGYFRQKASRLKNFVAFLDERYRGSLKRMFAAPTAQLREELLALNGIGPETADSILLYAGNHPVFVVDAYTRRIIERHGILPATTDYADIRQLFERALSGLRPADSEPRISDELNSCEREARDGRRGCNRWEAVNATCKGSDRNNGAVLPGQQPDVLTTEQQDWPPHLQLATGNSQWLSDPTQPTPRDPQSQPDNTALTTCNSSPARVFNEMHALIVGIGKRHCFKKASDCERCPLRIYLPQ